MPKKGKKIVAYLDGYKHILAEDYVDLIAVYPEQDINTRFISLTRNGELTINAGYAWDGASGPTWDTNTCKRGSLVHDCCYQLMREELLSLNWRKRADELLRDICRLDGMSRLRSWIWYKAVRRAALKSATSEGKRPIHRVP
jgi:hypothetical protein